VQDLSPPFSSKEITVLLGRAELSGYAHIAWLYCTPQNYYAHHVFWQHYNLQGLSYQVMHTMCDCTVHHKNIMPIVYFDNTTTCKGTASTGVRDGQLSRGEEISTKKAEMEVESPLVFHISSRTLDPWLQYNQIFILQYFHVKPCSLILVLNICSVHASWAYICINEGHIPLCHSIICIWNLSWRIAIYIAAFCFLVYFNCDAVGRGRGGFYVKSYQTNFILGSSGPT
jgi:hypothetical protein